MLTDALTAFHPGRDSEVTICATPGAHDWATGDEDAVYCSICTAHACQVCHGRGAVMDGLSSRKCYGCSGVGVQMWWEPEGRFINPYNWAKAARRTPLAAVDAVLRDLADGMVEDMHVRLNRPSIGDRILGIEREYKSEAEIRAEYRTDKERRRLARLECEATEHQWGDVNRTAYCDECEGCDEYGEYGDEPCDHRPPTVVSRDCTHCGIQQRKTLSR